MKAIAKKKKELKLFYDIRELYIHLKLPVADIHKETDFSIQDLKVIHPQLPYASAPFIPGFFSFVFVKDSIGSYTTGNMSFDAVPGSVYFTRPGQLKSYIWTRINQASMITVNETFLKENVHSNIFGEFPFLLSGRVKARIFLPGEYVDFEDIYEQISTEYKSESPYRKRVIGKLFIILLLRLKDHFRDDPDTSYPLGKHSEKFSFFKKAFNRFIRQK